MTGPLVPRYTFETFTLGPHFRLLVDDVQILPGAGAIQAEFLHVVTTLHNGGRKLVISADRAPRLLADLDDSLRDRLERGLAAELANDTDGTA